LLMTCLSASARAGEPEVIPGEVVVRFRQGEARASAGALARAHGLAEGRSLRGRGEAGAGTRRFRFDAGAGEQGRARTRDLARRLARDPRVLYAEPNYVVRASDVLPDDPRFASLWGLRNTGQTGGAAGADVDAPLAWETTTGDAGVIVAVVDSGIDYTHEDLVANLWTNPGEIAGNGVDDDGNGYVDDVHGMNAITGGGDPWDDNGHGTHCAGTIGAVGNNGVGVAGVAWSVKILAAKFLGADGSGSTADAAEAIYYLNRMKHVHGQSIRVANHSWGGTGYSQAVRDALQGLDQPGMTPILHVAAAGNAAVDIEVEPHYPAAYGVANQITVAATDASDLYASFTNWGAAHVDVAAPGVGIVSTVPRGACVSCDPSGYRSLNGTSMAAPHVAGAAALLFAAAPSLGADDARRRIVYSSDPIGALGGNAARPTLTQGRLDVARALAPPPAEPPGAVTDLAVSGATMLSASLAWTAPGPLAARAYDVRWSLAPITAEMWAAAAQAWSEPAPGAPGTPETLTVRGLPAGTAIHFAVRAIDASGALGALSNAASATTGAPEVLFADDMESGSAGWMASTGPGARWHLSTQASRSPSTAWYFGDPATGDLGAVAATGFLSRRDVSLGGEAALVFSERADLGAADSGFVRISIADESGANATVIHSASSTNGAWTTHAVDLSPFAGELVNVEFYATHGSGATGEGWFIDDVSLQSRRTDLVAPAAVSDLAVVERRLTSLVLGFTAPGDDGAAGRASRYDIRYSSNYMTEAIWAGGTTLRLKNEPTPGNAGASETFAVSGLAASATYYFAVKTRDEQGNWSPLSNVAVAGPGIDAATTVFADDVEGVTGAWLTSGALTVPEGAASFWNVSTSTATPPSRAWRYGSPTQTLLPGTVGTLILEEPQALGAESALLFRHWLSWDVGTSASVHVTSDDGATWTSLWDSATATQQSPAWRTETIGLSAYAGKSVRVLFRFTHANALAPDRSWFVDDIRIATYRMNHVPPAPVADLGIASERMTAATVAWTAPADDVTPSHELRYDVRIAPTAITDESFLAATRLAWSPSAPLSITRTGLAENTTYHFAARAIDADGNTSALSNVVAARTVGSAVLFADDMESGAGGWAISSTTSAWHISTRRAASPSSAWYFGSEATGNYLGKATSQIETVVPVDLTAASEARLVFKEWSSFENPVVFLRESLTVFGLAPAWGASGRQLFSNITSTQGAWVERTIDLAPHTGQPTRFAFRFLNDGDASVGEGTYIDDVRVIGPAPLSADFAAPALACVGDAVAFTDLSNGHLGGWLWSFGDGAFSIEEDPVHVYAAPGDYDVTLEATNRAGTETATRARSITVRAPVSAAFSATPLAGTAPLSVAFTDLSTGTVVSRLWEFGDGATSTEADPVHVYAAPATYDVRLTVSNECSQDTELRPALVRAVEAVAAGFSAPASSCAGVAVAFADASTGPVVSRLWSFGDGASSTSASPSHAYAAAGAYVVTLTVMGEGGIASDVESRTIAISARAAANFVGAPLSGVVPLTVSFTDQSTGPALSWLWQFGDGATSTTRNASRTYTARGTYSVTLTTGDACGSSVLTRTGYVTVLGSARVTTIAYTRINNGSVRITVTAKDELGVNLPGAVVALRWKRSNGTTISNFSGTTGTNGQVQFTASTSFSGCYSSTIMGVTRTGFLWNGATPANQYCR